VHGVHAASRDFPASPRKRATRLTRAGGLTATRAGSDWTGDWRTPRLETAEIRRQRVRDELLLAGEDPRRWPNAELAIDWHRLARGYLGGPDPNEPLDGLQTRADRYREQLATTTGGSRDAVRFPVRSLGALPSTRT
jgi:hypothetical protein